ncbi:MAG: phosphonate C-P lyase system protein PhnH [Pseudomonadota bacterium]
MRPSTTFRDAALGPQAVFRTLLDALARPGRVLTLEGDVPAPPPPAGRALYAAALALVDFETPLWLDAALAPLAEDLRFQTGAPVVDDPARAAFALVAEPDSLPPLDAFAQGTAAYPDRSTTLIVEVRGFRDGPWRLAGPGLQAPRGFGAVGLDEAFAAQWRANHGRFPCGVDLFLTSGSQVVGLPRTCRIEG